MAQGPYQSGPAVGSQEFSIDQLPPSNEEVTRFLKEELVYSGRHENCFFDPHRPGHGHFGVGYFILAIGLCQSGKSQAITLAAWLAAHVYNCVPCILLRNATEAKVQFQASVNRFNDKVQRILRDKWPAIGLRHVRGQQLKIVDGFDPSTGDAQVLLFLTNPSSIKKCKLELEAMRSVGEERICLLCLCGGHVVPDTICNSTRQRCEKKKESII